MSDEEMSTADGVEPEIGKVLAAAQRNAWAGVRGEPLNVSRAEWERSWSRDAAYGKGETK